MRAYRNSPSLFRTVPSPTPYGLPFPRLGFAPHPEIQPLLSQERTSYLARTIKGSIRIKSPRKILKKRKRGRIQGLSKFFGYPLLSQEREKIRISKFGQYIQRVHQNKTLLKILEKRERGRIQGLPNFSRYPLLSQEREKLRVFTARQHSLLC